MTIGDVLVSAARELQDADRVYENILESPDPLSIQKDLGRIEAMADLGYWE